MLTNSLLALFAYKLGALDKKGILCAFVLGLIVFYSEIRAYVILLMFFVGETIVEKILQKSKNEKRSFKQVLTNFCFPFVSLIVFAVTQKMNFLVLYSALLSEVMSDTLASTVGTGYAKKVFSLTKLKRMERGVSGGVSLIGTLAGLLGALYVSLSFWFANIIKKNNVTGVDLIFIIVIGFLGMITDSVIGDVIQRKYRCVRCGKIGDKHICCGVEAEFVRGFLSNSQVNFVSQLIVFITGLLLLKF